MPGSDTYAGIDFAIFMARDSTLAIYEDGTLAKQVGYYAAGDTLAVQVQGGAVTYFQNGAPIWASLKAPTFPLYFDSALYGVGATIDAIGLDIATPCWQETTGVSNSGLSVTKTAGPGWNANAESIGSIPGDGYVEFTTSETNTHKMGGLTHSVSGSGYATIDYAFYLVADGTIDIYEGGTLVNHGFGSYAAGDVFRVQVTGGVVTYLKNGSLLYTSPGTPTFPLVFDGSLYSTGATLDNVSLTSSSFWNGPIGVAVSGQSIVDFGNQGWGSGVAYTTPVLDGDGYVEFSPGEVSTHKMAGLVNSSGGHAYAIYLDANAGDQGVEIFEDNVEISEAFGSYAAGDVFRVQVTGGVVTYHHNGSLFYTSTLTPTFPLSFNATLYDTGTTVENVSLVPAPFWQNVVGVSTLGANLTKTGSQGWNAGASTVASLSGDGSAQFTTSESTTHKMGGLTHAVSGSGYATIDYAIYLIADGTIDIFEDGSLINQAFGSYVAGDVFTVQLTSNVVTYLKNGSLLYTSTKAPTFPLYFDASLYSEAATIGDVSVNPPSIWRNTVGVTASGANVTKTAADGWGMRRRRPRPTWAATAPRPSPPPRRPPTRWPASPTPSPTTATTPSTTPSTSSPTGPSTSSRTGRSSTRRSGRTRPEMSSRSRSPAASSRTSRTARCSTRAPRRPLSRSTSTPPSTAPERRSRTSCCSRSPPLNRGESMSKKALLWLLAVVACLIVADAGCSSTAPSGAGRELTAKTAQALTTNVTWTHALGVSVSGNSLTKTGASGWNAGATSNEYIVGPGSVTFTTGSANTTMVVGLAALVPDSSFGSIDFGFYLQNGEVWISEAAVVSPQYYDTYIAGDVFTIAETASPPRIQYLKNGSLLYESHFPPYPTQPYVVDCSIETPGATVNGVPSPRAIRSRRPSA